MSKAPSPSASAVSNLQTRKHQFVREAIWDAAIQLFAQKGFDATTIDDIAEAAGTSRRSFFRYFDSKSDLMAHGIVSYGTALTDSIRRFPPKCLLSQVFRETVLHTAQNSAAQPRTRLIMEIAAKYPAARDAQISRIAEVQEDVAQAFAERCGDSITAHALAALTLSLLSVTFRCWFENGQQDIAATVDQVFAKVGGVVCVNSNKTARKTRQSIK